MRKIAEEFKQIYCVCLCENEGNRLQQQQQQHQNRRRRTNTTDERASWRAEQMDRRAMKSDIQMSETNHMHVEIALGHEKCVFCFICFFGVCGGNKDANKQASAAIPAREKHTQRITSKFAFVNVPQSHAYICMMCAGDGDTPLYAEQSRAQ